MYNGSARPAPQSPKQDAQDYPKPELIQYILIAKRHLEIPKVISHEIFACSYYEAKELAKILAKRNDWIAYIVMEEE